MTKVLIAEDSSVIQNLVKKVLSQKSSDFEFTSVKNGALLLEAIEKETYDLFLVDVNMPKVNGFHCVEEIRAKSNLKDKPILAITGNANNYTKEEFVRFGFNDVVLKPINFDLLVQKVNDLISH